MHSEQDILRMLIDRPEKGLPLLMETYGGFVYHIVGAKLRAVQRAEDIEECVSDVFYECYANRHAVDLEKGSLKAFLAVLAKRRAIDRLRRHKGAPEGLSIDSLDCARADTDVEAAVIGREAGDRLVTQIKALGEPDSEILLRKYYFGQTTREIAAALRLRANTVDQKASRALKKLKAALGGML